MPRGRDDQQCDDRAGEHVTQGGKLFDHAGFNAPARPSV
jgi:hypothetical protein